MATRFDSTLVTDTSTDARFRAIAQFIEDTFVTTGGWVLSTETGDTAPGSLSHPTAANQKKGFRVYKTNDGLTQVFIRVDYGSGAASTNFGIWLTIGTGSDGAGTITGIVFNGGALTTATVTQSQNNTAGNTNATNSYGSADTGRIQLGLFISTTASTEFVLSLERTKDTSGNDTSTGLLLTFTSGGSSPLPANLTNCVAATMYLILAGGTQPTPEYGLSFVLSRANPSETFGGDIGTGVVLHFKGVVQQPGIGVCVVNSSDVSAEGNFTQTLYGSSHTYQHLNAIQAGVPTSATAASARTSSRIAIRYE